MIVYGCRITSEHRFRLWAGVGLRRVAQPEDVTALSEGTASLAEAYDEIVDAMRDLPGVEALVLVDEDAEITEPRFPARLMRRLREPGTAGLIGGDGAVLALDGRALAHVRFYGAGAEASSADLAALAAAQVRGVGLELVAEDVCVSRVATGAKAAGVRVAPADGTRCCTICHEPLPVPATAPDRAIVTCRECGVGVTLPEPARDITSDGIWEEQYGGNRLQARPQWIKEAHVRLDWIAAHRTGGTLVDIGCGTGELVAVASERGFEAYGIEPSGWGLEETRKLAGVAGALPSVEDWLATRPRQHVGVATLFHVLEHVHEPAAFLAGIREMLGADGLLFIEVPHFGSKAARRDPVAWTGPAISDHVLHYTAGALDRILRDTGYRVVESSPMPSMVYDDPGYWASRCAAWAADGYLAPPEDLIRVLAAPVAA